MIDEGNLLRGRKEYRYRYFYMVRQGLLLAVIGKKI